MITEAGFVTEPELAATTRDATEGFIETVLSSTAPQAVVREKKIKYRGRHRKVRRAVKDPVCETCGCTHGFMRSTCCGCTCRSRGGGICPCCGMMRTEPGR